MEIEKKSQHQIDREKRILKKENKSIENEIVEVNKWQKHEDFIWDLLNDYYKLSGIKKDLAQNTWINKTAQLGATTSFGITCIKKGLSFTIFSPTNKILDETVGKGILSYDIKEKEAFRGKVGNNEEMCFYNYKNPHYDTYHTTCDHCPVVNTTLCSYYKWLHDTDCNNYGITYSKFNFLDYTIHGEDIKEKLFNVDAILLDEFAHLVLFEPHGFFVDDLTDSIKEINKIEKDNIPSNLMKKLNNFADGIKNVEIDKLKNGIMYGEYQNKEDDIIKLLGAGYLMVESIDDIKNLKNQNKRLWKFHDDIFVDIMEKISKSMMYDYIWVYNKEKKYIDEFGNNVSIKKPYAFPVITHPFEKLKPYLKDFKGKIFSTGMMLPNFNKMHWNQVKMPDFNKTEDQHLIVCDTKKVIFLDKDKCSLDDYIKYDNWHKYKPDILRLILSIKRKFKNKKVIVFSFNTAVHKELNDWKEDKIENASSLEEKEMLKNIFISDEFCITHFRAPYYGRKLDYQIAFYLGCAQTPNSAYSESELLYGIPHEKMRELEISDTFQNALGRGKDPEGKIPKISFVFDTYENVISSIPKDKLNDYNIIKLHTQGTMYTSSNIYGDYWFNQHIWKERFLKEFSLNDLPMLVDMLRRVTDKKMITIEQLRKDWSPRSSEINTSTIKRLIKYLPGDIDFDGRVLKSNRLKYNDKEDYKVNL